MSTIIRFNGKSVCFLLFIKEIMEMSYSFLMPKQIFSGTGALVQAESILSKMGKKALVVTDESMINLGNLDHVKKSLENAGIDFAVFSGVTGEPNDLMLRQAWKHIAGKIVIF